MAEDLDDVISATLDRAADRGARRAYLDVLSTVLRGLDYGPEWSAARWVREREEAISALREVCGQYGDNDWTDKLHLSDIIEKHLLRHLGDKRDG